MKPFVESKMYENKKLEQKLLLIFIDSILLDGFNSEAHIPILEKLKRFYYHQP